MISKPLLLVLSAMLLLTACGGKTKSKNASYTQEAQTTYRTFFVKGDPLNLIAGSVSNNRSPILESNFENFNDYTLVRLDQFTERNELIPREVPRSSAEEGNEATTENNTEVERQYFSFEKEGDIFTYSYKKIGVSLHFSSEMNELVLKGVSADRYYEAKAIHYSQSKMTNAFSILMELEDDESGKILVSFIFVKKSEKKSISQVSTNYKYIFGEGVVVAWNQNKPLQVDICGKQWPQVEKAYKAGIEAWKSPLKKRLEIQTKVLTNYPPFSDLNSHCIYTVNNYFVQSSPRHANRAATVATMDPHSGKIFDGDIFFYVKEIEKFSSLLDEYGVQNTTSHEVGHLLGLDHQFNKGTPSIMSYELDRSMSKYDRDAVAKLYPLL